MMFFCVDSMGACHNLLDRADHVATLFEGRLCTCRLMRTNFHLYLAAFLLPHHLPHLLPHLVLSQIPSRPLLLIHPLQTLSSPPILPYGDSQIRTRLGTLIKISLPGMRMVLTKMAGEHLFMSSMAGSQTLQALRQIGKALNQMGNTSLDKISTSLGLSLKSHTRAFGRSLSSRAPGSSSCSRADWSRTRVIGATLAKILISIITRFWIKVGGTCQNRTHGQGLLRASGSPRLTIGPIATGGQPSFAVLLSWQL